MNLLKFIVEQGINIRIRLVISIERHNTEIWQVKVAEEVPNMGFRSANNQNV